MPFLEYHGESSALAQKNSRHLKMTMDKIVYVGIRFTEAFESKVFYVKQLCYSSL